MSPYLLCEEGDNFFTVNRGMALSKIQIKVSGLAGGFDYLLADAVSVSGW